MHSTELAYRKTAVEGASGFALLVALYDTLAGNLRRAAEAERTNQIEKRCEEVNHALLVIGYLEDWVERSSGGELAQKLVSLYSSLRRKLIEAQAKRSAEILEQQMELVLSIRESWQKMDLRVPDTEDTLACGQPQSYHDNAPAPNQSRTSSWSA
jgi:flagellar protein FliS